MRNIVQGLKTISAPMTMYAATYNNMLIRSGNPMAKSETMKAIDIASLIIIILCALFILCLVFRVQRSEKALQPGCKRWT